jgi:hypothetical protein
MNSIATALPTYFGPAYPKINSLWKRDPKTNLVIPGEFADWHFEDLQNAPWHWTEKIDGTNVRLYWDETGVTIGGRTDKAVFNPTVYSALESLIDVNYWADTFGNTPTTVFGEGYGAGIQKGGGYRETPGFIVFDVLQNGRFLSGSKVADIAASLGLDMVHYFGEYTLNQAWAKMLCWEFESTFPGHELEGIVGRPSRGYHAPRGDSFSPILCKMKYCDVQGIAPKPTLNGA